MGIFFVKNMGGLWDFSTKIWEEYGKNQGSIYTPKHYNVLIYDTPKATWDLKTPFFDK